MAQALRNPARAPRAWTVPRTADGHPIHGQNFLNPDGTAPNVLIGGLAMQVDRMSATDSQLLVTTPPDLAVNVEMQVVIRRTDSASVPETVIVAPSWPVLAMTGAT